MLLFGCASFLHKPAQELNLPALQVLKELPDSCFEGSYVHLTKTERENFIENYIKGHYVPYQQEIIGEITPLFKAKLGPDSLRTTLFDHQHFLAFETQGVQETDALPLIQIKIYNNKPPYLIGFNTTYYDFATTSSEKIYFYSYHTGNFVDVTVQTLAEFDFFSDHFEGKRSDSLNSFYQDGIKDHLLVKFNHSDTVQVIFNSYHIFCCGDHPIESLLEEEDEFIFHQYVYEKGSFKSVN